MAKHKRNRKFTVTRQRATLRAERERPMSKCRYCGALGGAHLETCVLAELPPVVVVEPPPAGGQGGGA